MLRKANKCSDCPATLKGKRSQRCRRCAARARYIEKHGKPAERLVFSCEACGGEFEDYASNRRNNKGKGRHFCSAECRATWTGIENSIRRGGDGSAKSKAEKDKSYYRRNAKTIRPSRQIWYQNNRERILEHKRAAELAIKQAVVTAYGGKCECCGESMIEFLTIDHINNDGALHRRRVGKGRRIYKDLLEMGCPKDNYRLLCFNCNIVRGFKGYCPHRPEERSNVSHVPFNPGRKRKVA